ncbi:hypothetical protein BVG81_005895 [Haliangium sp. UPWRP_2]|nr:hypothetical protein BVG81_005895 [Haliangium sp. UPWRP_2]
MGCSPVEQEVAPERPTEQVQVPALGAIAPQSVKPLPPGPVVRSAAILARSTLGRSVVRASRVG